MPNKDCRENLDTALPIGVKGHISVEEITNTGHTTNCEVDSDEHFIQLKIKNNSPVECAVRFHIQIVDGNIEFQNISGDTYDEFVVIDPLGKYDSPFERRIQIEENAGRYKMDEIEVDMKAESMDLPNPCPISETLKIKVN